MPSFDFTNENSFKGRFFKPYSVEGDHILSAAKGQEIGDSVTITGFGLDGKIRPLAFSDEFSEPGLGVADPDGRWHGQIDYYWNHTAYGRNVSERLKFDMGGTVDNVVLTVGMLGKREGVSDDGTRWPETGEWFAYDAAGKKLGSGLINPENAIGGNEGTYGEYRIAVDVGRPLTTLVIEARPFGYPDADVSGQDGKGNGGGTGNNSDFGIAGISYDRVSYAGKAAEPDPAPAPEQEEPAPVPEQEEPTPPAEPEEPVPTAPPAEGDLISSGLVAAYQSDRNVSLGDGNEVTAWLDMSGRGNNLKALGDPELISKATPTGLPAIAFDGAGDLLQRIDAEDALSGLSASDDDRTMYFVVRYIDPEKVWAGLAYGDGAKNEAFGLVATGKSGELAVQGWSADHSSDLYARDEGWIVQSVVLEDDVFNHYLNGELIDSGRHQFDTGLEKLIIGAEIAGKGEAQMEVAAAMIYNRALDESERASVETYLQQHFIDEGFVLA